jgi:hypothetical protein
MATCDQSGATAASRSTSRRTARVRASATVLDAVELLMSHYLEKFVTLPVIWQEMHVSFKSHATVK